MSNWSVRLHLGVAALVMPVALLAQSAGGVAGISGTVHDATGGVVPNAKVVISSAAKGQLRSIATNEAGVFSAPALIPGPGYEVSITAPGFAPYEAKELELQVGQNLDLNIALAVGQTATTVEVSAAAQLVEDSKTDVSQVVGTQEIMNLPINGRRVDSFVLNTPGVTNDGTFGLLTFRGVEGNNSFLLDGNDNTEQFYDENAGRTRIASQISADAVQEFQVVSSNYSAEYGRAMGGVVNTVTKSGTNQLHGGAFYFLRSTGFDAHDPYSNFVPTEHRIQTGGTVGGAIVKDKLFLFLSTDITRRNFPFTDSWVKVGIVDPVNQVWVGCGATPAQCQTINALLPRFYGQIPRTAHNDLYFGRLDYHLSDRNTLSASFNYLRWLSPNGIQTGLSSTVGAGITGNGDDSVFVRNGKFTWTSVVTNNIVNAFRYGLDTDRQADSFDQAELGGGLGYLDVAVGGSSGVQLGPATYLPRVEPMETRNEFADDATWTKGTHTVKAGFLFVNIAENINFLSNRFGSYVYQTVTQFAEDYSGNTTGQKNWATYTQTFGNPNVDYTIKELGTYLEDQWRATNKLTLTLGARYDHSFAPTPPIVNPDWPQTGYVHTGPLNLAPRIGIAYRVNDKTVIRGGFGTFYARLVAGMLDNVFTANGLYQTSITLSGTNSAQLAAGPVFPNALAAPPTGASVAASNLQFTSPNLKTPYTEQASLAVERQVGRDMALTVSGMWSHGVNLYGVTDLNAPPLGPAFTYKIDDASGNQVGTYTTNVYLNPRPNTKYGAVDEVTNGVSSYYAGLAVTFEKRFSHGLQFLTSYTWSHEIDDGQNTSTQAVFLSSLNPWTYNGNYGFDKGSGLIDQRHRLSYSFVWQPTFVHRNDFFSKYVINNWQLSSITTLASGRNAGPVTVRLTDTPVPGMLFNSTLDGFGGNQRVPFEPFDSLYTPPFYREDARLTKIIPISERVRGSLSFEAFNVSNSWTPTSLTTQQYTEAKGVLTLTPTAYNVGQQDGGFPDGTQARRLQVSARIIF
ncbi:MAG: TonB-dependent receptor [Acidobacteriia bacterium]|nr:TonB-dependent receptor [Terriglobia bacterium]